MHPRIAAARGSPVPGVGVSQSIGRLPRAYNRRGPCSTIGGCRAACCADTTCLTWQLGRPTSGMEASAGRRHGQLRRGQGRLDDRGARRAQRAAAPAPPAPPRPSRAPATMTPAGARWRSRTTGATRTCPRARTTRRPRDHRAQRHCSSRGRQPQRASAAWATRRGSMSRSPSTGASRRRPTRTPTPRVGSGALLRLGEAIAAYVASSPVRLAVGETACESTIYVNGDAVSGGTGGGAHGCLEFQAPALDPTKLVAGDNTVAVRVHSPGGKAGAAPPDGYPGGLCDAGATAKHGVSVASGADWSPPSPFDPARTFNDRSYGYRWTALPGALAHRRQLAARS